MPEMNGYEVTVKMKSAKPQVPILMLSAYLPLPHEVLQFVDASITKGESPERLFDKIRSLLNTLTPKSADAT
jgi:CheY-like chemotaxis protein